MVGRRVKRTVVRLLFLLEVLVFISIYVASPQGILVQKKMSCENDQQEIQVRALEKELEALKNDIVAWNELPFYKEKFAREQLQMARKDDQIYYIS